MIAVATGGPRIDDVQAEFAAGHDGVAAELVSRGLENLLPYRDLWEWYGRWSSGDMPSWQSRRAFVNDLFRDIVRQVQRGGGPSKTRDAPTGWPRVDRNVTEIRKRLETASTEEQFQAVGLLCRETLISLAQAVYDAKAHPTLDGVTVSETDAKRMLEAYINTNEAFAGKSNEYS